MPDYNWTSFTLRIPVRASREKLYWCWATREGMEYWFLRLCDYKNSEGISRIPGENVQTGDAYRWLWHGWSDETVELGTILDCNGTDMLRFGFGKAGNCTIRVYKEGETQILELLQDCIPETAEGKHYWHLGCKTGWTFYLTNLKSLLEGGIDLRNKDEQIKNVLNS